MTTYKGSCHCGDVRFEVELEPEKVIACNCSICSRMGWWLAFVGSEQFTQVSGESALTDYQFGKERIHHPFCRRCGAHTFSHGLNERGERLYSINVRCLAGVDLEKLEVIPHDGLSA